MPAALTGALPELASVPWRTPASPASLRRRGRLWTLTTVLQTIPFVLAAVGLAVLKPVTVPLGLVLLAYAWTLPELYAARGAGVLRRRPFAEGPAERVAAGLLGDLVDHQARALFADSGMVVESGRFGAWVLAEAGAVLVRPGGRRVDCFCVKAVDGTLPLGDRVAHLLLALRADESGFATVANHAFSGATWRLRRRLRKPARVPLAAAAALAARRGRA